MYTRPIFALPIRLAPLVIRTRCTEKFLAKARRLPYHRHQHGGRPQGLLYSGAVCWNGAHSGRNIRND
ncbi:hypothetical protein KCP69_18700 [Salmonella enterica subsp. enterica]|nr:hypothetical protein KCP69_18700 [Salmonella enterica subsp. enterica]